MKLSFLYLTEAPLEYQVQPEADRKDPRGSGPGFHNNQYKAWSSPKFLEMVKTKLIRLANHNIILIIGGDVTRTPEPRALNPGTKDEYRYTHHRLSTIEELSKATNIPIKTLQNSITVNLNSSQPDADPASPWMIIHQITEALRYDVLEDARNAGYTDLYGDDNEAMFLHHIEKNFGPQANNHEIARTIFRRIFKMQSAQNKTGEMINELFTEYLWHGGKIRVNYPEDLNRQVVDKLKAELETYFTLVLDRAVGKYYDNTSD